jgi:hydroxyacylglutathione hydrolase
MHRTPPLFLVAALLMTSPEPSGQLTVPGSPTATAARTDEAPKAAPPEAGSFPATWISGTDCVNDPPIQVHAYNDDFYIVRQSMCLNYEGPFLYLIFGKTTAILFDTGAAGNPPVAATVTGIINAWKLRKGVDNLELIVAHTHSHGDHVAGDNQFAGLPDTTVIGTSLNAVKNAFGLPNWPNGIAQLDLGGRVLDILPTPGHHATHITVYDRRTQVLITGDTLYPGFLFISSFTQYRASIEKLVVFTESNPVKWILGNHIEMTSTPGVVYPYGTNEQPDEHVLQLKRTHLVELNDALAAMAGNPVDEVHDDFIITP